MYRFTFFVIYRIHNIFHVFFLKFYYSRVDFEKTKIFMQVFELINDEKQWKIKEIFDKTKNKNIYYYKMKWINWNDFYNQWLSKKNLNNVVELKKKFDEKSQTSRKRKRSNFEKQSRKKQKKNNQIYEFIIAIASLFTWINFNFFDLTSNINSEHRVKMSIFRSKKSFRINNMIIELFKKK